MIAILISVSLLIGSENANKENFNKNNTIKSLNSLTEWIETDVKKDEVNPDVGGDYIENIKDIINLLEK
jgi:hypothetical protein